MPFITINYLDEAKIMTAIAELAERFISINRQQNKAFAEISARIVALQAQISDLSDQLANLSLPPEAEEALQTVMNSAQALDDIVPDETPMA